MAGKCSHNAFSRVWVIREHVTRYLKREGVKHTTFTALVRNHYESTVPTTEQTVPWSQHQSVTQAAESDTKKLFDMMDNTIRRRLPVELEEAIILSLPLSYRYALMSELDARLGAFVSLIPEEGRIADIDALGRLSKEMGDVFQRFGPILANGTIDKKDRADAPAAIKEIDEAVGVLMELRRALEEKALADEEDAA